MVILVVLLFLVAPRWLLMASQSYAEVGGANQSAAMFEWMDLIEQFQFVVMNLFVYLYVAFVGSCFASFLNVVAYRVPRGRSILGFSHCPKCDHRLSLKDNIPIWGWLKNSGLCRHCQSPISARYLLVEILLGVVFVALFVVEVVCAGFNLPVGPSGRGGGINFLLTSPSSQLILTCVYHMTLISILFTIAVISVEQFRIPRPVTVVSGVILLLFACCYPLVLQVAWFALPPNPSAEALAPLSAHSLITVLVGLFAGMSAGCVCTVLPKARWADLKLSSHQQMISGLSLIGLALGWQFVVIVSLIWGALRVFIPQRISNLIVLMVATFLHLMTWSLVFRI